MAAFFDTGLLFIIVLGALIFVHESGHFLFAKRAGVRVERFSLGFGPPLWRRQKGETEYRVSAIPLGGYVKMYGEQIDEEVAEPERSLTTSRCGLVSPSWRRVRALTLGLPLSSSP